MSEQDIELAQSLEAAMKKEVQAQMKSKSDEQIPEYAIFYFEIFVHY
jgi:hypothetical protein